MAYDSTGSAGSIMLASAWLQGWPQETYDHGGKQRGSKHLIRPEQEEERARREVLHTFKQPDLVRIHSLWQEQQGEIHPHEAVTSHQAPP